MSKIKGQNLRLLSTKFGGAIPLATSCSITLSGNTEDTSTKDSDSMFNEETVVSHSWQAQAEAYIEDADAVRTYAALILDDGTIPLGWDQTAGNQNRTAQNANFKRSGSAYVTDITMNFNDRETIQVSMSFQGSGGFI